jgi:hypothetical protein
MSQCIHPAPGVAVAVGRVVRRWRTCISLCDFAQCKRVAADVTSFENRPRPAQSCTTTRPERVSRMLRRLDRSCTSRAEATALRDRRAREYRFGLRRKNSSILGNRARDADADGRARTSTAGRFRAAMGASGSRKKKLKGHRSTGDSHFLIKKLVQNKITRLEPRCPTPNVAVATRVVA